MACSIMAEEYLSYIEGREGVVVPHPLNVIRPALSPPYLHQRPPPGLDEQQPKLLPHHFRSRKLKRLSRLEADVGT